MTTLAPDFTQHILADLAAADRMQSARYPGLPETRAPIHLLIGGAHRFKADTPARLGRMAQAIWAAYAPDFAAAAHMLGWPGAADLPTEPTAQERLRAAVSADPARARETQFDAWLAVTTYDRVTAKLAREPIEAYCLDFEDGYGFHPDAAEDAVAEQAGQALAAALTAGTLPPFTAVRIKPLGGATAARAARTLDRCLTALLRATDGRLPTPCAVLLPKVAHPAQPAALARLLDGIEQAWRLAPGALSVELMVELPQALIGADGRLALRELVDAAGGRCTRVHLGVYDLTAALGVTAAEQQLDHPAADLARRLAQLALAGSPVQLVDGANLRLALPPHRAADLTPEQAEENRAVVARAWQATQGEIDQALRAGIYQGWDLHPHQLPARYAAVYSFFRRALPAEAARMRHFLAQAAQATQLGTLFDDAATGRGLLNTFRQGLACGALSAEEVAAAGLDPTGALSAEAVFGRFARSDQSASGL